jgi:predicted methyltransferase
MSTRIFSACPAGDIGYTRDVLKLSRRSFVAALPALAAFPVPANAAITLGAAIAGPWRSPKNTARDKYRHPEAMLTFFGLTPRQTVLEIEPGGGYWTEILAPYLKPSGHYIAALPTSGPEAGPAAQKFLAKLAATPALYSNVAVTGFGAGPIAPPAGIDLVLSFRNLHDWLADGSAAAALAAIHAALKPGGIFGIEDHRASATTPQDPHAKSGYVRQDYATALITEAGFRLAATSELGANPRDTKNYPKGVWTLPPTLAAGATDRARYLAIGESDRWTLKFVKPY